MQMSFVVWFVPKAELDRLGGLRGTSFQVVTDPASRQLLQYTFRDFRFASLSDALSLTVPILRKELLHLDRAELEEQEAACHPTILDMEVITQVSRAFAALFSRLTVLNWEGNKDMGYLMAFKDGQVEWIKNVGGRDHRDLNAELRAAFGLRGLGELLKIMREGGLPATEERRGRLEDLRLRLSGGLPLLRGLKNG